MSRPASPSGSSAPPSPSSASQSRLHLPPHAPASSSAYYEGDAPSVLADVMLRPPSNRPKNQRNDSWASILSGESGTGGGDAAYLQRRRNKAHSKLAHGESDRLLDNGDAASDSHTGQLSDDAADDQASQDGSAHHQHQHDYSSRSRSRSARSKLAWYKRPSPIWFIPGTLFMAITMGMTIAPKIEIYTQLICRAMPVEKSGVTVPPPLTSGATSGEAEGRDGVAETGVRWEKGEGFEWTTTATGKEDDESWAKQCHKSSAVQSAVARLALILSLLMGILSSLTTGAWGAFSDRRGRKPVLVLALFGSVLMDSVFLITVNYHQIVGYNFLLLGPFLDGLVGGLSTAQATTNAYLSDCTPAGSRARVFSLLGGLLFAGIAVGPSIGSLLIARSGSVLLPFYVALGLHLVYLGLLMVFLPESLSAERKETARRRHEAEVCAREEAERNADEEAKKRGVGAVWRRRAGRVLARPFGFLRPVGLLLPVKKGGKEEEDEELRTNLEWGRGLEEYEDPAEVWARDGDGEGKERRDWGLTKIAGAYAAYMMIIAIMSVKLLYANYTFAWGPREDGFFLSYIGALRFFTLVGILPCFVSLVRRPAPAPVRPRPAGQGQEKEGKRWDKEQRWLRIVHDSHFDLHLARLSLLLDLLGFLAFSLSSHRIPLFLFATALQSLGSGASPAIQSLALAHSTPRDAGRLFASLSVVQSLASQVVGPVVFGLTFMNTVGSTPEAIFWLAGGLCAVSGAALCTVRLRRVWIGGGTGEEAGKTGEEEETEGPGGRGRSETRKRTNASEISLRSA
ncbi:hypothetical protein JCM21900_004621 [Sporobolomyces salmonicolor]